MRVIGCFFLCILCVAVSAVEPTARVIISTPEVAITDKDVQFYIAERLASGHRPEAFQTSKGIAQSAENLLSLRLLAAKAKNAGAQLDEQLQWELDLYRDRLLYRAWVDSLVANELKTTDWDKVAREEFAAHREKYTQLEPEQVSASHILVNFSGRSEEQALARIKEIQKRLDAGEDFNVLAEEYSDDPSAKNNRGNLGYFPKGRMVAAFQEKAFAMNSVNEISEPVKTRFGYHLIKYQGRKDARALGFDDVKEAIITSQQAGIRKAIQDRLTTEARSIDNAKVNEDALKFFLEQQALSGKK